jgi:hypothetical protein
VKRLLAHRLDGSDAAAARREWHDLVEGQHALWAGVSDPYKHTIRAFLVHFHSAILRHSSERFNFVNGSIGAADIAAHRVRMFVCGAHTETKDGFGRPMSRQHMPLSERR